MPAGVRRQPQRRTFRPDHRRRGAGRADSAAHQVGARQLAELHAEQRPTLQADRSGRGREAFLHDLRRGARGEGIASARQIRPRQRLRDRPHCGREGYALRILADPARGQRDRRGRARAGHREDAEHIAHPVGHRDHRRQAARLRLAGRLRDNPADIRGRQDIGSGGGDGGGDRAGGRGRGAAAAARAQQQRAPRERRRRHPRQGPDAAGHAIARTAPAACASAARKSSAR